MAGRPSSAAVARSVPPRDQSQLYMFGPAVDLGVIAGGLTFILFPLCMVFASHISVATFLVLLFFCNYPHYMATLHRVYRNRSQIERYKFFAIYVTGLLALTAVLGQLMAGVWLKALYTLYFTWSPFHYTGQNYGISLMYLRRGGTQPTNRERWLLYIAFIACFFMYAIAINTDVGVAPAFPFQPLGIPAQISRVAFVALLATGIGCAAVFLWHVVGRTARPVLVPVLLLMGSQFAWFPAAIGLPLFSREFGPGWAPIQALFPTVAFLHCAQYLGVTAYYAKRDRMNENRPFSAVRYLAVLIIGGVFLWIGTARVLSQVFALDYGTSFLIMLSLINLHHFIMDGAIWKLRDGRLAKLLLTPDRPIQEATAVRDAAPSRPRAAKRKERRERSREHVAPAPRAHPRVPAWHTPAWAAAAAVALVLAGSDIYYRLGIFQANQVSRTGDINGAVRMYNSVWGVNWRASEALDGLAFWSLKLNKVQEAVEQWEQSIRLNPTETSVYAHVGVAEAYLRMGRVDEAMQHLQKAMEYRPDEPSSYILMANAYDQRGVRAKADEMRLRASHIKPAAPGPERLFY